MNVIHAVYFGVCCYNNVSRFSTIGIPSMSTTVDLVFCIDYASTIISHIDQIRKILNSTWALKNRHDIGIGLVKLDARSHLGIPQVHGSTQSVNELIRELSPDKQGEINPDGYEAVGMKKLDCNC